MPSSLHFQVKGLFLPMRITFKQASSVRNHGESVWCEVHRDGISGCGEGCPRIYVTNETVDSALEWINEKLPEIQKECITIHLLKSWMVENRMEIDEHPAAFCAIETALLDLFSKEKNVGVEKFLGWDNAKKLYHYTGVLSDGGEEKFIAHSQRFLQGGFTDFKIKVNGDIAVDQKKFKLLFDLAEKINVPDLRIRLDANNLWKDEPEKAIDFLSKIETPIFGIEEPVAPKDYQMLSKISRALDLPIILDESLCNLSDLKQLDQFPGKYILNLKVSRVGGLLRSLEMIEEFKKRNHQIIIGAHVGETSILTRAGMCAAQAAAGNLASHEGGFGLLLLENEPVAPSLMFGAKGQIDLATINGNWSYGWGLKIKS